MRPEAQVSRPPPPPEGAPFALIERGARGLTLAALNPAARAAGLRHGQAHADACAILPALLSAPVEPERDAAALRKLALWAERFSPAVAVDARFPGQEGLTLDMTGGAHLFGGEAALLADLRARLARADIPARVAIADTAAAAWALARFDGAREVVAPPGRTREAVADLPVDALRLQPQALVLLRRFGLRRIGDLYGLPRAGLARRFRGPEGLRVVERLDQVLGVTAEPLRPERPAPVYRVWTVFADPLTHTEGIAHQLPGLAQALTDQLERDGQGARTVSLVGFRVDGRTTAIEAALSAPAAAPAHLMRLLKERGLERLDLGFGVDALMLCANKAEPMRARQTETAPYRESGQGAADDFAASEDLAALIDRLRARLGDGAVGRPRRRESWVPERSEIWVRADPIPPKAPERDEDRQRPILLFDPPEPVQTLAELPDGAPTRFIWRRAPRRVVKAEGPERLAPEWWRAEAAQRQGPWAERTRDYYRVEDDQGRRYWIFREGLYGREDADRVPSWWLHGVFA
jgi:protein ImuB